MQQQLVDVLQQTIKTQVELINNLKEEIKRLKTPPVMNTGITGPYQSYPLPQPYTIKSPIPISTVTPSSTEGPINSSYVFTNTSAVIGFPQIGVSFPLPLNISDSGVV